MSETKMSAGALQIAAIFANPGKSNKEISNEIKREHGVSTENTVAWYRTHAKKGAAGKLGKTLRALVDELGGPSRVPSAVGTGGAARGMSVEDMVAELRKRGLVVAAPEEAEAEAAE